MERKAVLLDFVLFFLLGWVGLDKKLTTEIVTSLKPQVYLCNLDFSSIYNRAHAHIHLLSIKKYFSSHMALKMGMGCSSKCDKIRWMAINMSLRVQKMSAAIGGFSIDI